MKLFEAEQFIHTGKFLAAWLPKRTRQFQKTLALIDGRADILIDSGAFEAFRLGIELDVEEYVDFIKSVEGKVTAYVQMDVVSNISKTLQNYEKCRKLGINPMGVFHFGNPSWVIDEFADLGCDYLGFGGCGVLLTPLYGGAKDSSRRKEAVFGFLDRNFKVMASHGMRCHLLGSFNGKFLEAHPFYSSDASTAAMDGAYARKSVWHPSKGRVIRKKVNRDSSTEKMVDLTLENFRNWNMYSDYLTALWKTRGVEYA